MKTVDLATGRPLDGLSDAAGARSGSEVGSWVIASAAFLLVALRQTYVIPGLPLALSPARFILFAGAAMFVVAYVAGRHSGYRLGALAPVLTLYLISTLTAYGIGMTQEGIPIKTADYYVVVEIMLVLTVVFYYNVIHSYAGLSLVVKGLVAGGVVSATFAILAHFTGTELATVLKPPGLVEKGRVFTTDTFRVDVVRPQGSAGHPLELGAVMAILFPLALGLTYSLRAAGQRWRPWAVATLVIGVGVGVSVSRSALMGLFAACVFMALYWPIRRTIAMFGGMICLVLVVSLLNPSLFKAYTETFGLGWGDPSAQYRLAAAQYILSHFSVFGSFADGAGTSVRVIFDNQYLHQLSETGVFGLLSYVLLLGTASVLAFRAFTNARSGKNSRLPPASAPLLLGLTASFIAYAFTNVVLDVGGYVQIWTTMWLMIATAAVAYRISGPAK